MQHRLDSNKVMQSKRLSKVSRLTVRQAVLRAQVKDCTYFRWRTDAIACMHMCAHATPPGGRLIVIHTHNYTDWGQREQQESEGRQVLPLEDRRGLT